MTPEYEPKRNKPKTQKHPHPSEREPKTIAERPLKVILPAQDHILLTAWVRLLFQVAKQYQDTHPCLHPPLAQAYGCLEFPSAGIVISIALVDHNYSSPFQDFTILTHNYPVLATTNLADHFHIRRQGLNLIEAKQILINLVDLLKQPDEYGKVFFRLFSHRPHLSLDYEITTTAQIPPEQLAKKLASARKTYRKSRQYRH